jgi:hypothetical protein
MISEKFLLEKTARSFTSSMIGQRLIEAGHITEQQLREALAAQAETGLLLGEVCMLKGWINYFQLRECLPPMRSRIGERLLSAGLITIEQLWKAILEQRQTGELLGEILVSNGCVKQAMLDKFLDRQH